MTSAARSLPTLWYDRRCMSERRVGRYELFGAFASGGAASVEIGRVRGDGGFTRVVAVKRLHPSRGPDDAKLRAMIADEAQIASRIIHPNVVVPFDVLLEGDEILLVMEYVAGDSLSRLVRRAREGGTPIPVPIAIAILRDVLRGLHAAHEARAVDGTPLEIVHRDVSPQNVLVGIDGTARLVDFGVAKALGRSQSTMYGEVKGKPAYMAPEQLRAERLDRRVDVFAAGIVLWELLTGERLFHAETPEATILRVLERTPDPPSTFAQGVPPEIDSVVMTALAKSASERFATAAEMCAALDATDLAAPVSRVSAWVELLAADVIAERERMIPPLLPNPPRPRRRRFWPLAPIALLVGLTVAGLVIRARRPLPAPPPAQVVALDPVDTPAPDVTSAPTIGVPTPASRRPPVRRSIKQVDCHPPYVIDANGTHILKPECL
jgi:eukaryotic-like serine/threonine-protein kinase